MKRIAVISTVLLLAGCGGSGDGASLACTAVGGSAVAGMSIGSASNVQDAVDENLSSFARVSSVADGEVIASGAQFNGGGNAGLFVTPPSGTTAASMTVNTRMNGTVVESATGPGLVITETANTAATNYVGFDTTQPFNQIQFLFTNGGEFLIFEFCGSASLN